MRFGRVTALTAAATLCACAAAALTAAAPALAAPTPAPAPRPMPMTPAMPMPAGHMEMMTMMMAHMSSVTVQGTGQVTFTPDIAHVNLGVNGEAQSAAAAAADIAGRANAVINALKGLGIAAGDIATSGFNLFYRQPTETVKGAFVASENISVKTPVDKAGDAIDAGLHAGANQTYGLNFDTSKRDALYRQAVAGAVQNARDLAQAAASAAGIKLGPVTSIDVPAAGGAPVFAPMAMARAVAGISAPPPVEPGTGTISASVTVRFGMPMPMAPH